MPTKKSINRINNIGPLIDNYSTPSNIFEIIKILTAELDNTFSFDKLHFLLSNIQDLIDKEVILISMILENPSKKDPLAVIQDIAQVAQTHLTINEEINNLIKNTLGQAEELTKDLVLYQKIYNVLYGLHQQMNILLTISEKLILINETNDPNQKIAYLNKGITSLQDQGVTRESTDSNAIDKITISIYYLLSSAQYEIQNKIDEFTKEHSIANLYTI